MSTLHVDLGRAELDLDLKRRLEDTPATAHSRGVFFNLVRHELTRLGPGEAAAARRICGDERRSFAFYQTRELLKAFAEGGALLHANPREGVRRIFKGGPEYFASTWYGRAFQRFLRPDPGAALDWIERSREHVADYGYWRIERRAPGHVVVHMVDEYIWIDSAQRGGCEGLLLACGVIGEVHAELDTPYRGRLDVRWRVPA